MELTHTTIWTELSGKYCWLVSLRSVNVLYFLVAFLNFVETTEDAEGRLMVTSNQTIVVVQLVRLVTPATLVIVSACTEKQKQQH